MLATSLLGAIGSLGCVACTRMPTVTTLSSSGGPITELSREKSSSGAWLATLPGATGLDVRELANGDLLLLGHAKSTFVQRLSPEGETRWSLPFVGCGLPRIALGDNDAIYVAMQGPLAVGEAAVAAAGSRRAQCHAGPDREPAAVLRVSGRGEVLWRWDQNVSASETPQLLPVRDQLIVVSYGANAADPTTPASTIVSLNAQGHAAWTQVQGGTVLVAALSPKGRVLLGVEWGTSGTPCSIRALDATSGKTDWETQVGLDVVGTFRSCLPGQLSVTPTGAIIWTSTGTDAWTGVDPETGNLTWTRNSLANPDGSPPFPGTTDPERLAPFISFTPSQEWRSGNDAVLIGVDPSDGRTELLARLTETVPEFVTDGPNLAAASKARGALLLTGSFYGSLSLLDMRADTSPEYSIGCRSIDPGFFVGPAPTPPAPQFSRREWRGLPRVTCPDSGYFPLRDRIFTSALFLAKVPMRAVH